MKFKFFKKAKEVLFDSTIPLHQNTLETIQAIHNEFDTAADRALEEAMFILSQEGVSELKKEKASLMSKFGFTGTKQVEEVKKHKETEEKEKHRAQVVAKYREKYPQYKFIFMNQVHEICKKYELVCGPVEMYKGDVPLKNLKEIEMFKVKDEEMYYVYSYSGGWVADPTRVLNEEYPSHVMNLIEWKLEYEKERELEKGLARHGISYFNLRKNKAIIPFFICAPKSEMNTKGYKMDGVFAHKEIPDPIVLHYVKDGFLVVSKWGIEGDDPIVNE